MFFLLLFSLSPALGFPLIHSLIHLFATHTLLAHSSTLTLVHTHLLTLNLSEGGTSNGPNVFPYT